MNSSQCLQWTVPIHPVSLDFGLFHIPHRLDPRQLISAILGQRSNLGTSNGMGGSIYPLNRPGVPMYRTFRTEFHVNGLPEEASLGYGYVQRSILDG